MSIICNHCCIISNIPSQVYVPQGYIFQIVYLSLLNDEFAATPPHMEMSLTPYFLIAKVNLSNNISTSFF